jgi:hypothetical protein
VFWERNATRAYAGCNGTESRLLDQPGKQIEARRIIVDKKNCLPHAVELIPLQLTET